MNRSLTHDAATPPVLDTPAVGTVAPMYATRRVLWSWGYGWSRPAPAAVKPEEREPRTRGRRKGGATQKRK